MCICRYEDHITNIHISWQIYETELDLQAERSPEIKSDQMFCVYVCVCVGVQVEELCSSGLHLTAGETGNGSRGMQ